MKYNLNFFGTTSLSINITVEDLASNLITVAPKPGRPSKGLGAFVEMPPYRLSTLVIKLTYGEIDGY